MQSLVTFSHGKPDKVRVRNECIAKPIDFSLLGLEIIYLDLLRNTCNKQKTARRHHHHRQKHSEDLLKTNSTKSNRPSHRWHKKGETMNTITKTKLFFALLFFVLNVTVAFTVNPTESLTPRNPHSDSSCPTTTTLGSSSSSSSSTTATESASMPPKIPLWFQHEITITAPSRGCHLVTSDVQKAISNDISQLKIGMCNLFIQHTSASLTINENADPDVRRYATTVHLP